jgi:hypothetical protein
MPMRKSSANERAPVPTELGEPKIHLIRGQKAMLEDFMFRLNCAGGFACEFERFSQLLP